jgi:DNA repair photolyase
LEVCRDFRNPAIVVTRSFLVVRDIDLLVELNAVAGASVCVSIPFADRALCKIVEPQAPPPERRFEAVRRLSEAGLGVTVFVSPIIPGLNDRDIPTILEKAAEAGAKSAMFTALRLPGSVEDVFVERLRRTLPLRAKRVINGLREIRGGALSDNRFGARMRGTGAYWKTIAALFEMNRRRFGLIPATRDKEPPRRDCGNPSASTVRAASAEQLTLPFRW